MEALRERVTALDRALAEIDREYQAITLEGESEIDELKHECSVKLSELLQERESAKREFRLGLFCSECDRPKSQIERETGKSFQQHLIDVRGRAIPKSEAEIAERMLEYDKDIAALSGRCRERISEKEARLVARQNSLLARRIEVALAKQRARRDVGSARNELRQLRREYRVVAGEWDRRWKADWADHLRAILSDSLRGKIGIEIRLRLAKDRLRKAILEDHPDRSDLRDAVSGLESELRKFKRTQNERVEALLRSYGQAYVQFDEARRIGEEGIADRLREMGLGGLNRLEFGTISFPVEGLQVTPYLRRPRIRRERVPNRGGGGVRGSRDDDTDSLIARASSPGHVWDSGPVGARAPRIADIVERSTIRMDGVSQLLEDASLMWDETKTARAYIGSKLFDPYAGDLPKTLVTKAIMGKSLPFDPIQEIVDKFHGQPGHVAPAILVEVATDYGMAELSHAARKRISEQSETLHDYYSNAATIDSIEHLSPKKVYWDSFVQIVTNIFTGRDTKTPMEIGMDKTIWSRLFSDDRELEDGEVPE